MKIFNYNLCSPALIYLVFSMTQVIVDSIKGFYNVALLKFTMMILFTLLLNILCERGLGLVSWIIVFIPFILMSVITSILLFVFGLDPSSGNVVPPASTVPKVTIQPTHSNQSIHSNKLPQHMSNREKYVRAVLAEDELSEKPKHHHHKLHTSHINA